MSAIIAAPRETEELLSFVLFHLSITLSVLFEGYQQELALRQIRKSVISVFSYCFIKETMSSRVICSFPARVRTNTKWLGSSLKNTCFFIKSLRKSIVLYKNYSDTLFFCQARESGLPHIIVLWGDLMVYIRKKKKNIFYRIAAVILAVLMLAVLILRFLNSKLDVIVADMVEEGLKNTITKIINESVAQGMREGDYRDILSVSYSSDGKVRSMVADSVKINLLCADVGARISEKLDELTRFYVEVDVADVLDDVIVLGKFPHTFCADVVPVGGIETDIESEFLSAGINQTNYRLNLKVDVGITAVMLISTATIDVSTSVSIAEMLIVGDVPTVYWG
ncbi:MAG: hypothetical protein E7608_01485 [Ruminococcaceae bacterium]|nr:hypothetical protein [Oscillospiraceae bacterium]